MKDRKPMISRNVYLCGEHHRITVKQCDGIWQIEHGSGSKRPACLKGAASVPLAGPRLIRDGWLPNSASGTLAATVIHQKNRAWKQVPGPVW